MTAAALRVLSLMRTGSRSRIGLCAVCHRTIADEESRTRLPDGTSIHRDCSTYRMRQRQMVARRFR